MGAIGGGAVRRKPLYKEDFHNFCLPNRKKVGEAIARNRAEAP